MQLDFFPSRTLTLYLAKMFVARIAAMLFVLVLVLMMLDLLSSSGEILAVEGNGQGELLTYAGLRIPQLVSRFLPYSVLLATIITLAGLNQNSEVVSMKAAGLCKKLEVPGDLLDSVDVFIFDCDGVIWKGDSLIDGVPAVLEMLRKAGKKSQPRVLEPDP